MVANELPSQGLDHPHSIGNWLGTLDPSPSKWESSGLFKSTPFGINLETPNGETHDLQIKRFHKLGETKGVYIGSIEENPFSSVTISFVGKAVVGALRFPDQGIAWEIRNQDTDIQIFEKVDLTKLKGCATCRDD